MGVMVIYRDVTTEKDKGNVTEERRRRPFSVFEEDSFDLDSLVSSGVFEWIVFDE